MTKRLVKRHKRQVARAKDRAKTSEPDLRTPEQIRAAKEMSRPAAARRNEAMPHYPAQSATNRVERPPGNSENGASPDLAEKSAPPTRNMRLCPTPIVRQGQIGRFGFGASAWR